MLYLSSPHGVALSCEAVHRAGLQSPGHTQRLLRYQISTVAGLVLAMRNRDGKATFGRSPSLDAGGEMTWGLGMGQMKAMELGGKG